MMDDDRLSSDGDDEYEKLVLKMNPPRVVVDNESSSNATVVRVDSANKYGILLEVVQVLIDLNLNIVKAYISSDGGWFMDVFNVTDEGGNKIKEEKALDEIKDYIRKSLGADSDFVPSRRRRVGFTPSSDHTSIELTGTDRPGLLSELSAVLTSLNCNVVNAEIWTHNTRAAAVIQVTDGETGLPIIDPERLSKMKELLHNLLKGRNQNRGAKTEISMGSTHKERRLHQMMYDDRDFERTDQKSGNEDSRPKVSVANWLDKDYSVISIKCKDRPKLLFDVVCTLTDMQYVVFHGNVNTEGSEATQEFCIRHLDGYPVNSELERQRVIQCLEAAIVRRVSEGVKLEVCSGDRVGLLKDVTQVFRENGLNVARAEVSTRDGKAVNTFYICDSRGGHSVDARTLDTIRNTLEKMAMQVKGHADQPKPPPRIFSTRFLFGGLFKLRSRGNPEMIKSYS